MHVLEHRLHGLAHEKHHLDETAHMGRIQRLQTTPHTMREPHIAGSHAHALYAGGQNALPPRSWLDTAPMTKQLLQTHVPEVALDAKAMSTLFEELAVLKKVNPAEAIATLQRLKVTATEKL